MNETFTSRTATMSSSSSSESVFASNASDSELSRVVGNVYDSSRVLTREVKLHVQVRARVVVVVVEGGGGELRYIPK